MNWYDFGRNEIYAGTGGNFRRKDCVTISQQKSKKLQTFFLHAY